MTKYWITGIAVACALVAASIMAVDSTAKSLPRSAETAQIVQAANSFLAALDTKQRESVLYAFGNEQQRERWSNLPTGFVPRGGISLREMTPAQRSAAMNLLAVALSKRGYEKVQQIMEGDEVNKKTDTGPPGPGNRGNRPPRGNGGPPPGPPPDGANRPPRGGPGGLSGDMFGRDLYYISFLGTPSEQAPWMLQFGGHHLALNITIDGGQGILTPTLTGAQPALYTEGGRTVRPLGPESDKALALLNSLDDGEKKQAILSYELADLVLGPGQDGKKIQPEGLKATSMTDKQRAMLLDVISEWAGIINDDAAAARMTQLKADINQTWFAWSGPTTGTIGQNIRAYYRIQGPHLVIEYSPQTLGGDPACMFTPCTAIPPTITGRGYQAMKWKAIAPDSLFFGGVASAHRLDEYLQATLISVEKDHVEVSMRLIPGIAVSSAVIASIDTNGDGVLSPQERWDYAQRVLSELALSIDGKKLEPKLKSADFPQIQEMRDGLGEIQIEYTAKLPGGGPNRKLILENNNQRQRAVYLVNALAPSDPGISIVAQKRNQVQSTYELDYTQAGGPAGSAPARWWTKTLDEMSALGLPSLFRLGMSHIAEGTDHLLFLLVLLLAGTFVSGRFALERDNRGANQPPAHTQDRHGVYAWAFDHACVGCLRSRPRTESSD